MNLEEGVSRNTTSHIFIHIFLPYICILEWLYVEGTLELRLDVVLEANVLFNLVIDIFFSYFSTLNLFLLQHVCYFTTINS